MKKVLFFTILVAFSAMVACNKDKKQAKEDRKLILADLELKGLTATEDPSGIFYIIDVPGNDEHPTLNSTVKVGYKGTLLDGSVFDQTGAGETIEFPLSNLIEGWQIAIPLLGKNGHGTFWIPSELGYGGQSQGGIPANSVLVFEISLKDFK